MNKKTFLLSISSFIFLASCGGGGGGGGGSDMTSPPAGGGSGGTTYTYTKVTSTLSNYDWDTIASGVVYKDLTNGYYTWNNNSVYLQGFTDTGSIGFTGYDNYNLDATATENTSSFELVYSGVTSNSDNSSISLNLTFSEWNTYTQELYEYGQTVPYYITGAATFADAEALVFFPLDSYHNAIGIEYVSAVQLVVKLSNDVEYILPTVYGDYTETGDMPTNTVNKQFRSISYYFEQDYDVPYSVKLAVVGDGNLSINHSSNTISGTLNLDNWMDLVGFLEGNGPTSQYTSIPNITFNIINGQIVGNNFSADLVYDDTANSGIYIGGKMTGGFFGPDASEIGASFILYDAASNNSDFYFGGGWLLGE